MKKLLLILLTLPISMFSQNIKRNALSFGINNYIPNSIYENQIPSFELNSGIGFNLMYSYDFQFCDNFFIIPSFGYSNIVITYSMPSAEDGSLLLNGNKKYSEQWFELSSKLGYKVNSKFNFKLGVSFELDALGETPLQLTNSSSNQIILLPENRFNVDVGNEFLLTNSSYLFLLARFPLSDKFTGFSNRFLSIQSILGYRYKF